MAKDVFLFDEGLSRMVFERDAAGKVSAMRFFADDEGEGDVVKRSDEPMPAERDPVALPSRRWSGWWASTRTRAW